MSPENFTAGQDFFADYVLTPADNLDCAEPNKQDFISFPNSNAFIDLNGDCLADIILTRQDGSPTDMETKTVNTYYEVYAQVFVDGKSKYCLASQDGKLVDPADTRGTSGSAAMPFLELADFNRDGMIDMAFATETGELNILFNQKTSPGPKAANLCNDVGNTADLLKPIFPKYPFTADQNGVV